MRHSHRARRTSPLEPRAGHLRSQQVPIGPGWRRCQRRLRTTSDSASRGKADEVISRRSARPHRRLRRSPVQPTPLRPFAAQSIRPPSTRTTSTRTWETGNQFRSNRSPASGGSSVRHSPECGPDEVRRMPSSALSLPGDHAGRRATSRAPWRRTARCPTPWPARL